MDTLPQKVARVWREKHPLTRAGTVLVLPCLLVQDLLEPAFKNALSDPARPTAAQVSYAFGLFDALTGVLILKLVGFLLAGLGVCLNSGKSKRAIRQTPWWRDR